jgi:hypothetical protein
MISSYFLSGSSTALHIMRVHDASIFLIYVLGWLFLL